MNVYDILFLDKICFAEAVKFIKKTSDSCNAKSCEIGQAVKTPTKSVSCIWNFARAATSSTNNNP